MFIKRLCSTYISNVNCHKTFLFLGGRSSISLESKKKKKRLRGCSGEILLLLPSQSFHLFKSRINFLEAQHSSLFENSVFLLLPLATLKMAYPSCEGHVVLLSSKFSGVGTVSVWPNTVIGFYKHYCSLQ